MRARRNLEDIRASAAQPITQGPFHLYCAPPDRVTDPRVIPHYLDSMMGTYQKLSAPPYNMCLPVKPINTFIVPPEDLIGARSAYDFSTRTILLPATTDFPTRAQEREWMAAAARHEVVHAMCDIRSDHRAYKSAWYWLCEAFAIWVETLFPGDHFLGEAHLWREHPELSLRNASYDAFPFMNFFIHQLGVEAFKELWSGDHKRDPWEAILEVAAESGKDRRLFFADYCLSSYVPYDKVTRAIFDRFNHRYAAEIIQSNVLTGEIESLACRYYRVPLVRPELTGIRLRGDGPEWMKLQVSTAQVLEGPSLGRKGFSDKTLSPDLTLEFGKSRHLVIVVSNDSTERTSFHLNVEQLFGEVL